MGERSDYSDIPDDLFYDGPEPGAERRLFVAPIEEIPAPAPAPKPETEPDRSGRSNAEYAAAVTAALDILSFRLAVIIAVAAEAGMFGYSVWNPDVVRIAAAAAFAVLVGIPLMYFYRNPG